MKHLRTAFERQPNLHRFLCHLYQRIAEKRLNLVTGAGISIDVGVPSWFGLLDRLSERSEELKVDIGFHRENGLNPEYLGQIIFHRIKNEPRSDVSSDLLEATVNRDWSNAIHEAIYKDLDKNITEILGRHPYLNDLCELAKKLSLVINFNFDDILAEAMNFVSEKEKSLSQRPFTVVYHPPLLDRSDATTIYHVNGVLPRENLKKRSPQLIFTEDSFADALARSPGISSEYIFLRFVQNTMLLIGHSLNDTSLKNYLRLNRDKCPANHHYMIYWLDKPDSLSAQQRNDLFEANLELYNLITIFLTSPEIKEVLELLNKKEERDFRDLIDDIVDEGCSFNYYIVGPVAAGKSSVLEQLRCFHTYEEWTRLPPKEMYLSFDKLDDNEKEKVDNFVYGELKEKNIRISKAGVGFHFMDRAPLDLYAFSNDDKERKDKTKSIKSKVTRHQGFQRGEIIFVTAKGETLVKRNLGRGRLPSKSGEEGYLEQQSGFLKDLYNPNIIINTDNMMPGEAARKIARHVLLDEYSPIDLNKIMDKYS
ncbi:hypothetical protein BJL95_08115 [Methylomonas sp. LWB]|uniref:SIR2 family protein n=1 Tax=Methylomonas sp. LWB TaxID=1905845 RepID=UPI0008D91FC4|nr:SIR2 family protein [Methylomonas sp. LWB]OHX37755.1 hypothetical protein BJL95_08115 [Methylomonas sp. LWB]